MFSSKKMITFASANRKGRVLAISTKSTGEVLEWLKRHAWKACSRQNWLAGSNPVLSAGRTGSKRHKANPVLSAGITGSIFMKRLTILITLISLLCFSQTIQAQESSPKDSVAVSAVVADDSLALADSLATEAMVLDDSEADSEEGGFHKQLKTKFIDGNAGFMSLVALALVLGLAFCIERIIYLTLSEIKAHKLMEDIEKHLQKDDVEGAKAICRNTRGPVASVCYQGLMHINQSMDAIERSITNYGGLQAANLEKGCSWIKLFIAMAPSLGFLGTVIGMVMAFDHIQQAGDIGPKIVASGMKVALITTIFGIIVALILQLFYSYILSKIERLTAQMEESAITLLDLIAEYKSK